MLAKPAGPGSPTKAAISSTSALLRCSDPPLLERGVDALAPEGLVDREPVLAARKLARQVAGIARDEAQEVAEGHAGVEGADPSRADLGLGHVGPDHRRRVAPRLPSSSRSAKKKIASMRAVEGGSDMEKRMSPRSRRSSLASKKEAALCTRGAGPLPEGPDEAIEEEAGEALQEEDAAEVLVHRAPALFREIGEDARRRRPGRRCAPPSRRESPRVSAISAAIVAGSASERRRSWVSGSSREARKA